MVSFYLFGYWGFSRGFLASNLGVWQGRFGGRAVKMAKKAEIYYLYILACKGLRAFLPWVSCFFLGWFCPLFLACLLWCF